MNSALKEVTVDEWLEHIILYIAGAMLLSITASRFLLQESITLVRLFKQLIAEIRSPYHSLTNPRCQSRVVPIVYLIYRFRSNAG